MAKPSASDRISFNDDVLIDIFCRQTADRYLQRFSELLTLPSLEDYALHRFANQLSFCGDLFGFLSVNYPLPDGHKRELAEALHQFSFPLVGVVCSYLRRVSVSLRPLVILGGVTDEPVEIAKLKLGSARILFTFLPEHDRFAVSYVPRLPAFDPTSPNDHPLIRPQERTELVSYTSKADIASVWQAVLKLADEDRSRDSALTASSDIDGITQLVVDALATLTPQDGYFLKRWTRFRKVDSRSRSRTLSVAVTTVFATVYGARLPAEARGDLQQQRRRAAAVQAACSRSAQASDRA